MRFPAFGIVFLLTFALGLPFAAQGQEEPSDSLASAPGDSLAERQLSTDSVYSSNLRSEKSLIDLEILYHAEDSMPMRTDGSLELYNQAWIEYGDIKIEAGYILIQFKNNELYASGLADSTGTIQQKPVFTEKGKQYQADEMRFNFDTKKARINKVITQEGEGFLHGRRVKKVDDKVFYIRDASFTTCSHEHPHFRIRTPKAKIISGEKIVTRFAFMEILDIPTPLMVPFGFFPTSDKRKSGILVPSYGNSQFRGYFLQNGGFYWAASDYVDLALTGDIYTKGGFGLQAASSYNLRYKFRGNLNFRYNLLKFGEAEFQPFISQAFQDQSDFSINWSHQQDPKANPEFRFSANVNIASTSFNQIVGRDPNMILQNRLNSSISLSKSWTGRPFNLNVTLNHSQNNQTKDLTLTLPQVNFSVNRLFPFRSSSSIGGKRKWYEEIGVTYTANAKNQIQTRMDQPVFTPSVFRDSSRMGMEHTAQFAANYKVFKYFVLTPGINYSERWYPEVFNFGYDPELQQAVVTDTLRGFFANRQFRTNANLSTKIYGTWRYKGFLRALRHVATPTVGLNFTPDFSDDFWGYYQRVQVDSLGNTALRNRFQNGVFGSAGSGRSGGVNFGIQNTLEAKIRSKSDSTGLKKIRILEGFNLSTNYNAAAESRRWSPISLSTRSSIFDGVVSLNYNARLDLYGVDPETGANLDRYAWETEGKLFRVPSQDFALGANLNANTFASKKERKESNDQRVDEEQAMASALGVTGGDIDYYRLRGYVDFNMPWNFSINYNLRRNLSNNGEVRVSQALTFNGNVDLTQGWKIGFNSGFDLEQNRFTVTNLNFMRDLHCWQLTATWVPFGFQQQYVITVRVKSTILQDLKLERRRGVGDLRR